MSHIRPATMWFEKRDERGFDNLPDDGSECLIVSNDGLLSLVIWVEATGKWVNGNVFIQPEDVSWWGLAPDVSEFEPCGF